MNLGKSIQELANELDNRASMKHDVVADSSAIHMRINSDDDLFLEVETDGQYDINQVAHNQLAAITQIPNGYYNRLRESSNAMVAGNVNHWLEKSKRKHMVRSLGGTARAVLSDRYLRIENEEIARNILPVIYDIPNCIPLASDITDSRMYMKFLFEGLEIDITGKGDTVKPGFTVQNSEVGSGKFVLNGFFWRDFCYNGCTFGTKDMGLQYARTHLGSKIDTGVAELFSDETIKKNHDAIISASVDILKHITSKESLDKIATSLRATTEGATIAPTHVTNAVEVLGREYGLTGDERVEMLGNLINDNDFSRWGVVNSITKIANDKDFDKANTLENIGGKIIDINQAQWTRTIENINSMKVAA